MKPNDAGVDGDTADAQPAEAGSDADACRPTSCAEQVFECGELDDGCGAVLDCGSCTTGFTCEPTRLCLPANECTGSQLGALACYEFEHGLDAYDVNTDEGSLETAPNPSAEGPASQVLKANTTQANAHAMIVSHFPAVDSGSLFFRFYLYVPDAPVSDRTKIAALEPPEFGQALDFWIESDNSVGAYLKSANQQLGSAPGVLTQDTWTCVRGEVLVDNEAGGVRLWLGDEQVLDTSQSFDTQPAGGFGTVFFGIHWADLNADATTLYLDKFVLATSPIACEPNPVL